MSTVRSESQLTLLPDNVFLRDEALLEQSTPSAPPVVVRSFCLAALCTIILADEHMREIDRAVRDATQQHARDAHDSAQQHARDAHDSAQQYS